MLVQFSFGNFRSFKDTATLSMVAAEEIKVSDELNKANVFTAHENPRLDLLRVAALYGPNASGKSNILLAMMRFRQCVFQSANIDYNYGLLPFLLNTDAAKDPVFFQLIFLKDNVQYRYGFAITVGDGKETSDEIQEEWLFAAKEEMETSLFERRDDSIERASHFSEGKSLLKDGRLKRKDSLFLSLAAQNGEDVSSELVNHIRRTTRFISGINDESMRDYTEKCLKNYRYRDEINSFLRELDTGISSIAPLEDEDVRFDADAMLQKLPSETQELVREEVTRDLRIAALHPKFDGTGKQVGLVPFPLAIYGSEGTKKLFAFAGPLFDTLHNGYILFVDEMDARFHPLLTQAIVGLFQSPESNPKNAQLVFVTHDTNLLYQHKLRRDQIWFVQKDRVGASHLYSLADIDDVDEEGAFGHDYSQGYYGAIPYLNGFARTLKNDANS